MDAKNKNRKPIKLSRILSYLKRVVSWVFDGGFYILLSIVVIVTILYVIKVINFSPNFVASGLSIIGLVIILTLQVFDAIDFAEHKPNTFINWIKSFPTLKPITITANGIGSLTMFGKARARLRPRSDAILEEKIDFLLRQVDNIQNVLDNLDDRIDKVDDKSNKNINELKAEIKRLSTTVNTKLAEHIVGSYDANIFGVIITICGIVIQVFRG
jgi:hypothetical protein